MRRGTRAQIVLKGYSRSGGRPRRGGLFYSASDGLKRFVAFLPRVSGLPVTPIIVAQPLASPRALPRPQVQAVVREYHKVYLSIFNKVSAWPCHGTRVSRVP